MRNVVRIPYMGDQLELLEWAFAVSGWALRRLEIKIYEQMNIVAIVTVQLKANSYLTV